MWWGYFVVDFPFITAEWWNRTVSTEPLSSNLGLFFCHVMGHGVSLTTRIRFTILAMTN